MMFWKTKKRFEDQVRAMVSQSAQYTGANRRAINLVPLPVVADGHEIAQTQTIRFHHLLVSIEGNQRTCCLKVISTKKKSRSAILIFRGRVVGCLYGRKDLDFQVMQQDAQMHALADLATPGNILDAYQLPEDLVLAAASLFHGQTLEFGQSASPEQVLLSAVQQITSFSLPGCIVLSTDDSEMICQVYMANGKIIGVYSSHDGWVAHDQKTVMSYLAKAGNPKVMASILAMRSIDDVAHLGFSLTGLGDRRYELIRQEQDYLTDDTTKETTSGHYYQHSEAWFSGPRYHLKKLTHKYENAPAHPSSSAHYPSTHRLHRPSAIRHAHVITP